MAEHQLRERKPGVITPSPMQDATIQDNNDGEQLLAMLQQGEGNAQRVSQHACLLDRRLRGGGTVADLRFSCKTSSLLAKNSTPFSKPLNK